MSTTHTGNMLNEITREEHDGLLNAKRSSLVSAATIYAVVNTGVAGIGNSIVTVANTVQVVGNAASSAADSGNPVKVAGVYMTTKPTFADGQRGDVQIGTRGSAHVQLMVPDSATQVAFTAAADTATNPGVASRLEVIPRGTVFNGASWDRLRDVTSSNATTGIGLLGAGVLGFDGTNYQRVTTGTDGRLQSIVTVANKDRNITGNVTLSDAKTYIGLTTTTLGTGSSFIGIVTVANLLSLNGNITLDAGSKTQIIGNLTLSDPKGFIGLVTVVGSLSAAAGNVTLDPGSRTGIVGNITLSDSKAFIGLTTTTLGASPAFIGIVTVTNKDRTITGNLTLSDAKTYLGLTTTTLGLGDRFIGLVTAITQNAGTTKTLLQLPILLSTASILTIVTPTNANRVFVTNMILSSDATVRVSIKSGVTYLTGNASLGITLNPGGGFIQSGSPDSPSWIGLPSGALIVEKFDMTGTKANIGGNVVYFQE